MGWASGLQSGMALGSAIRQGQIRNSLEEEAKKYNVTAGAYGEGLSENLQNVIAARDTALQGLGENATPEQIQQVHAQYTPAMAELSRRVGLTAPDYSVSSGAYDGGKNYATLQEAQVGLGAAQTRGMADVYRSYGDVEKAGELESRAIQQRAAGLQANKFQREEETAIGNKAAMDALAEIKAAGTPVTSQTLAELAKTHKGDYQTLLTGELHQLGYDKESAAAEVRSLKTALSKASLGGIPAMNKFLADKFDPDKTDNITPEIVQTKNGLVVMYGGNVLNDYGTHKSLDELIGTVSGRIDGDTLGTMKTLASIRASNASAALHEGEVGLLPEKKAYYGALAGAAGAKSEAAATAQESRAFTELTKTPAWQAAERKNDRNAMNELMVGRGLDPAKHGAQGAADWNTGKKPTTEKTPAAKEKTGIDTSKPAAKDTTPKSREPSEYVKKLRATPEEKAATRARELEIERLKEEELMRARSALAADFDRKYRIGNIGLQ